MEYENFDLEEFLEFAKRNKRFYQLMCQWLDVYRKNYFDLNHFIDFVAEWNIDFYYLFMAWLEAYEIKEKKEVDECQN